ncbi:MAG TPA: FHA domain-containing protein [Polyangia bacterium]|nr:FHA domain-containing protein [Polyangia bacterium]
MSLARVRLAALLALVLLPSVALAGPAVITTRPVAEGETPEMSFFVGAIGPTGRSLKATNLELVIDGQRTGTPLATQALADWAAVASEASPTWRPPLTVGLVYLWIEGVPAGVLDGIQAFFRRVPSRTPLYPTIYGRMRQDRARLTAADVSRLAEEVPYLEGYRPNLIEALRLDLQDLTADAAPLKLLLVVTDGRDFADPKGDGPGDFGALGRQIRKAGITPLIVAFPAPEADAVQAAANLRDLQEAAGGFLRTIDQVQDLENALESLGQAVADLQRAHFTTPWNWRTSAGTHRLSVRLAMADGQQLTADLGSLTVAAGRPWWILIVAGAVVLVGVGVALALKMRGGGGSKVARAYDDEEGEEGDEDELLTAAHDLIRRGVSPKRAVDELMQSYPDSVGALASVSPEVFTDGRFPYFRTRLGRLRMQEISEIVQKRNADRPGLASDLAAILAASLTAREAPEKTADALVARVPAEEWTAFAGLDLEQLAEALAGSSSAHAVLGTPRARGAAVAIQDALKSRGGSRGIAVGWLVRAGGPGNRGETILIGGETAMIGQGPTCAVRLMGDPSVAGEHAELSVDAGVFTVIPREGAVSVEGKKVERRHVLSDGETLGIGAGLFVFKCASAGNLARPSVARVASRR